MISILGPHAPELRLRALRRLDVIHDVDVHVIENNDGVVTSGRAVVDDVSKNDAGVRGGDFDR